MASLSRLFCITCLSFPITLWAATQPATDLTSTTTASSSSADAKGTSSSSGDSSDSSGLSPVGEGLIIAGGVAGGAGVTVGIVKGVQAVKTAINQANNAIGNYNNQLTEMATEKLNNLIKLKQSAVAAEEAYQTSTAELTEKTATLNSSLDPKAMQEYQTLDPVKGPDGNYVKPGPEGGSAENAKVLQEYDSALAANKSLSAEVTQANNELAKEAKNYGFTEDDITDIAAADGTSTFRTTAIQHIANQLKAEGKGLGGSGDAPKGDLEEVKALTGSDDGSLVGGVSGDPDDISEVANILT